MVFITTESNQGGGLHGRTTAVMKDALYSAVKKNLFDKGYGEASSNLNYCDLFDLVGGNSFGSISTVAMSRIRGQGNDNPYFSSPGDFGLFIDSVADRVFPHSSTFVGKIFNNPRQLAQGLFGATSFGNKYLRSVVEDIVGKESKMEDVKNDVILVMNTTEFLAGSDQSYRKDLPRFAKSHIARGEETALNPKSDAKRKNWNLSDVVLGSAAPSTILPGVELRNDDRDDTVIAYDGAFSGFNDPSIPVAVETALIYGEPCSKETGDIIRVNERDIIVNNYNQPDHTIHLNWGTGNYSGAAKPRTRAQALSNTALSMGPGSLVAAPMKGINHFETRAALETREHYYLFDIDVSSAPKNVRPSDNFTLSSKKQMRLLRDLGQYAVDQLSDQIEEVAELLSDVYIERLQYEARDTDTSYKDYLKSLACDHG